MHLRRLARTHGRNRSLGVGLSVISRLVERAQVFGDDTKLMKLKSGRVEANLNPKRDLRRLKRCLRHGKRIMKED